MSFDGAFMITSLVKLVGSVRLFPSTSANSFSSSGVGSCPNNKRYAVFSKPNSSGFKESINVLTLYPRYHNSPSHGTRFPSASSLNDVIFETFVRPVRTPFPLTSRSPRFTPYSLNKLSDIVSFLIHTSCLLFAYVNK